MSFIDWRFALIFPLSWGILYSMLNDIRPNLPPIDFKVVTVERLERYKAQQEDK
jgi:hypothetical protein